jgi:hypothetical protein
MNTPNSGATKFKYILKLIGGLTFLAFAIWLSYWLLFDYKVRNILGILAIIIFLIIPSIISLFTIPGEIFGLIHVLKSKDPKSVEKALGDIRGRGPY